MKQIEENNNQNKPKEESSRNNTLSKNGYFLSEIPVKKMENNMTAKKRVTFRNIQNLAESYGLNFIQSVPIRHSRGYSYQYILEMNHNLNKWIKKNYKVKINKGKYDMWNYDLCYDVVDVNFEGRENIFSHEERTLRYTKKSQHYKNRFPNLAKINDIDLSNEFIDRLTDLSWEEWEDRFASMVFVNSTDNPDKLENPIVKAKDYHMARLHRSHYWYHIKVAQ